jgi:hypothetical protein
MAFMITINYVDGSKFVFPRELRDLPEKHIGISQTGALDLLSMGFANCTGVIICSTDPKKKGGLVAHISGGGANDAAYKKDARETADKYGEYIVDGIQQALNLARKYLDKSSTLAVALFNGPGSGFVYPMENLKDKKIKIQDLRHEKGKAGALLLDTEKKTLYLWNNKPSQAFTAEEWGRIEKGESRTPKAKGEIAVKFAQNKLPYVVLD